MPRVISALFVATLLFAPVLLSARAVLAQEQPSLQEQPPLEDPSVDEAVPESGTFDPNSFDTVEQSSVEPTATFTPVAVAQPATDIPTSTPTATPTVRYPTRKGPRSAAELAIELRRVGYAGPWDVTSLLAAYDRATAPTPTPVPTSTPAPAPTRAVLDPVLASRCAQFTIDFLGATATYVSPGADFSGMFLGLENGCRAAATDRGAVGETCHEFAVTRWFRMNLGAAGGVSPSTIEALYHLCLGG